MSDPRELLCAMMIRRGLATGHADTFEDALAECEAQIKQRQDAIVAPRYERVNMALEIQMLRDTHVTVRAEALEQAAQLGERMARLLLATGRESDRIAAVDIIDYVKAIRALKAKTDG